MKFVMKSGENGGVYEGLSIGNIGNYREGLIKIFKYEDMNGNGVRDPTDPGIPNWPFTISGKTGNDTNIPESENGRKVVKSLAQGDYVLKLPPGQYKINEGYLDREIPTGWVQTQPAWGSAECKLSYDVTVISGQSYTYGFGNFKYSTLKLRKYEDVDADTVLSDDDKKSMEGWILKLTGADGIGAPVSKQRTSDAKGKWSFENLRPGTYKIAEVQQQNWFRSTVGMQGLQINITSGTILDFTTRKTHVTDQCCSPCPDEGDFMNWTEDSCKPEGGRILVTPSSTPAPTGPPHPTPPKPKGAWKWHTNADPAESGTVHNPEDDDATQATK
jgi:uncharacterized protein (DUF2141 family)